MAIDLTLAKAGGESTPESRHTAGVAQLLRGNTRTALSSLAAAAQTADEPRIWSDLAAAFYEAATREQEPQLLADALANCDRALALDADFPEALFNRALVIERLGLRDDAREAWERYLARDPGSAWAGEARTHRDELPPWEPFLQLLDRQYDRAGNDAATALSLVVRDPAGARGIGVMEVLGRWGNAVSRHDDRDAERHLKVARQLGAAVVSRGGDPMLARAVAAIDAADAPARSLLAAAHADYQGGLTAFQASRPVDAEPLLRRSASEFARAQNPMALPARYFAANTVYEQGHHVEAERQLEELLATSSSEFAAYRALVLWQLATCKASRADWGAAIELFEKSASLFERLGEIENAAAVRRLLAFTWDRIGVPGTAWNYRVAALHGMGRRSNLALAKAVSSIADAAILRREWSKAAAFLNLGVHIARRLGDDVQLADTLLIRAVVRDRLGDALGARTDVGEAKDATARSKDPAYREILTVAGLRASAMLTGTPPAEAEALLTQAIESTRNDRLDVPGLLLQRARARRNGGNAAGAMADVRLGIDALERHRDSLPEGEARWGAFHAAEELFDEGVELALSSGDEEAAFRFVERARARSLLEIYGRSPVLDFRRLPARTVVVEYAALPSRLVIFTADSLGVRATSVDSPRATLANEIDTLTRTLRENRRSDAARAAAIVYQRLIEPIAPRLLGATTVAFVPDSVTSTVAFSALTDAGGSYLIERHALVISASAAAFAAASERGRDAPAPQTALLLSAGDGSSDFDALASVDAETRQIAAAYPTPIHVREDAAQFDELLARAPSADVIHFAGHAIGDDRGYEPASIVLRQDGRARRVGVAEIATLRLRRTAIVVLAGCSTSRGERRTAEGVISVAHGFLSAGAPSVIATLWPIEDSAAARFFPRLHERLAEGDSPAEALRAVQLESIRRGDVPPSLWAAVQDIGS
jgi:CHAT domain-containing protein